MKIIASWKWQRPLYWSDFTLCSRVLFAALVELKLMCDGSISWRPPAAFQPSKLVRLFGKSSWIVKEDAVWPFAQQLEGHQGEDEEAEHEEQEDVEDLRQSVPDASERSAELNTNKQPDRRV